ncbi:MAG TPA: hypothetical protein DGR79_03440 [Clostridiales bacterium]|nr:hypothetical protein [Clostridiales bacterium]
MHQGEGGPIIGDWTMRVESVPEGEGWLLVSSLNIPSAPYSLNTTVRVGAEDLLPVHVDFELLNFQGTVTYTAEYGEGKVAVDADVRGEPQSFEIRLPDSPYFDNEQFIMTLRAMPLADGWSATLNNIITATASKRAVRVEVVRREDLTVPAGTYSCWVVELVGASQRVWIAVDWPYPIVKFVNDSSRLVALLESYEPGE